MAARSTLAALSAGTLDVACRAAGVAPQRHGGVPGAGPKGPLLHTLKGRQAAQSPNQLQAVANWGKGSSLNGVEALTLTE